MSKTVLEVRTMGVFSITDPKGKSLTPKGNKECALLAYLACSENGIASRNQIYNLLWSDRSEDQQSASLRRALSNIRTALGDWSHVLTTKKRDLRLNIDRLSVDIISVSNNGNLQTHVDNLFLESLTVRDNKYKKWRMDFLTSHKNKKPDTEHPPMPFNSEIRQVDLQEFPSPPPQYGLPSDENHNADLSIPTIDFYQPALHTQIQSPTPNHNVLQILAEHLKLSVIQITQTLGLATIRDFPNTPYDSAFASNTSPGSISSRITIYTLKNALVVNLSIMDNRNFSIIKCIRESVKIHSEQNYMTAIDATVQKLVNFLVNYNCEFALRNPQTESAQLSASVVVKGLFIPGTLPIDDLEANISKAIHLSDTPIYRTMRATLSLMRYGERLSILNSQLTDQILSDLQLSLTAGADNGVLLAWIGHAHGYFLKDHNFSLQLSSKALDISPHCWLCWMFRATTLSYANKGSEAQIAIRNALSFPIPISFRPFVLSNAAQAECLAGNFEQATSYATEALKYNNTFQATSRTLLTSYSMSGDYQNAAELFWSMRIREKDLSIDLIRSDGYPIPSSDIKSMLLQGLNKIDFGVKI